MGLYIEPAGSQHFDRTRERRPVVIVLHQEHSQPGAIGHWLRDQGYPLDIYRPRFGDRLPCTLEGHSGAIIFGGPMSANDPDEYITYETNWIEVPLKEGRPFLGVCLGAQMLARLFGSTVARDPSGAVEIGYHSVKPTGAGSRLGAWPGRFYQWHREGFGLPRGCELLAQGGNAFPIQAFASGSALAVQFHPEITHAMVARWTGRNENRLKDHGADDRAKQLADHVTFSTAVRTWLDQTLKRWLAGELPQATDADVNGAFANPKRLTD